SPIYHLHSFGTEELDLPRQVLASEVPTGADDPPPGNLIACPAKQVPHRSGRPGKTGLFRHLPIGHYFSGRQALQDGDHGRFEILVHPVFLIPAAMPLTVSRIARWRSGSTGPSSRAVRSSDACRWLIGSR